MRELDKKFHKALIFCDEHTKSELDNFRENKTEYYNERMPIDIENDLVNLEYINIDPDLNKNYILMPKGQEELRKLDDIKWNRRAIIISVIAAFIAGLTLFLNGMGVI